MSTKMQNSNATTFIAFITFLSNSSGKMEAKKSSAIGRIRYRDRYSVFITKSQLSPLNILVMIYSLNVRFLIHTTRQNSAK